MARITTNIKRIFKYGFLGFLRNGFVSLATVLVMTIALFMISVSMYADAALKSVLNSLKEQVDINVYFAPDADEKAVLDLKEELEKRNEVKFVEYKSKEEVLMEFKERHKNDELTIQSLEELGENPFGATLSIKAKDPEQYEAIANYLNKKIEILNKDKKIIDKINFTDSKKAIDTLNSIIRASKQIAMVTIAFLVFIAVLIVFNTIRLAVYTNKEEIAVMKLVGASDAYVQGPFVVEGALYGLVSAVLTFSILWPLSIWLKEPSEKFLASFNTYDYFVNNAFEIMLILLAVGVLLGVVSSYLSVRKYLDV